MPSDEGRAALHEERRQQQRQEYLAYLKSQAKRPSLGGFDRYRERGDGGSKRQKSISDLRRELSHDRDREIDTFDDLPSRHRERDEGRQEETRRRDREEETGERISSWRDRRRDTSRSSASAPILPGLGLRIREESEKEKRERQNQYRSELQAQMREKKQLGDVNGRDAFVPQRRAGSPKLPRKPGRERSPPLSPPLSPERGPRQRSSHHKDVENYKYRDERHSNDRYEGSGYYSHPPYHPPPHFIPPYTTHGPYQSHAPYYYPPFPPPYPPPHHMRGGHYNAPPTFTEGYPDEYPSYRSRRHRSPNGQRERSPEFSRCGKSPPTRSPSPERDKEQSKRNHDQLKSILTKKTQKEKEREKFIKKMEAEVYDPWGRPGAGAPLTDATGNLVTERGLLRKSFDELSPRLSEEEKRRLQQEKQKEELEKQIKEKEEKELKEKLMKQQEDQDEEARIREEMNRLHLQAQYEKEKEKERGELKVETAPKPATPLYSKQELAELRFKEELEKKKRKEEEERKRLDRLADKLATEYSPFTHNPNNYSRTNSPPLPALLSHKSPPIPTLRNDPHETTPTPAPPIIPAVITTPPNEVQHNLVTPPTYTIPPHTVSPPIARPTHNISPRVVTPPLGPPSPTVPPIYHTTCEPTVSPNPSVVRLPVERGQKEDILQNLSSLKDGLRRKLPHANLSHVNSYPQTHTRAHPQTHTTTYPNTESYHINPQTHPSSNSYSHTTLPQTHSTFPHTFNPHTHTNPQTHAMFNPQTHTTSNPHTMSNNPPIRLRPTIPKGGPRVAPSETIDTFNRIKYAAPTSSLLSFWKQYPEPPRTNSDLELQQDALLHHQRQNRDSEFYYCYYMYMSLLIK